MKNSIDIHVNIPREMNKKLDKMSKASGATKTFLIVRALREYLKRVERLQKANRLKII